VVNREIRQPCHDETAVLSTCLPMTSRASPATYGGWQVEIRSLLVFTLAAFQEKKKLLSAYG
jgi:hypothetical protein